MLDWRSASKAVIRLGHRDIERLVFQRCIATAQVDVLLQLTPRS
jgi:hypothetical protein